MPSLYFTIRAIQPIPDSGNDRCRNLQVPRDRVRALEVQCAGMGCQPAQVVMHRLVENQQHVEFVTVERYLHCWSLANNRTCVQLHISMQTRLYLHPQPNC